MKRFLPVPALGGLVLLAALGCLAPRAEAANYRNVRGVAPGHVAWIYLRPSAASPHVGYLKAGALRVRTMGCRTSAEGGWCKVMRRGTRGWVQDRYLQADRLMRS